MRPNAGGRRPAAGDRRPGSGLVIYTSFHTDCASLNFHNLACNFVREEEIQPSGKNWRSAEVRLIDLEQINRDLESWPHLFKLFHAAGLS
jgi:hypothetical protein